MKIIFLLILIANVLTISLYKDQSFSSSLPTIIQPPKTPEPTQQPPFVLPVPEEPKKEEKKKEEPKEEKK